MILDQGARLSRPIITHCEKQLKQLASITYVNWDQQRAVAYDLSDAILHYNT